MKLEALIESRNQAQAAYSAFVTPLIEENRALTDEESARKTELRGSVDRLNDHIAEVRKDEARDAEIAESRQASGLAKVDVSVLSEPKTYSQRSEHSYMQDICVAAMPGHPSQNAAQQRIGTHNHETAVEIANDSTEGRKACEVILSEHRSNRSEANGILSELRQRGKAESRAITTGASSAGAFAPPIYLLDDVAYYRQAGRSFINAANTEPLPSTGMVINVPAITGPAGEAVQSTQNTAVTETDPTAGYISANVQTVAGQLVVSQQSLDRTGPMDGSYDSILFNQLTRAYNAQADVIALTAALAGAGSIAYTGTFAVTTVSTAGGLYEKLNGAQSVIRTTAGVFGSPSHIFMQPSRWGWIASFADSSGRPLVVPGVAGPNNAVSAAPGSGQVPVEGFTGFQMTGLPVYQDANIPVPGTGADQIIVADMSSVYVMEGALTPRAIPQSDAVNLSVRLQLFAYMAVLVLYPLAVQSISGTALGAITF